MKTIAFLVSFLTAVSVNSQVLYIREAPEYNSKIMKLLNRTRDSLGLKPLKESAEMDSAAKHHAYYTAYDLMLRKRPNHDEINDIPNFLEKLKPWDRGAKAEIMAYPCMLINENDVKNKSYESVLKNSIDLWYEDPNPSDFSLEVINIYKRSPPHYDIMKDNIGKGEYGSFSLFVIVKTPFDKDFYRFCFVNIIDFK